MLKHENILFCLSQKSGIVGEDDNDEITRFALYLHSAHAVPYDRTVTQLIPGLGKLRYVLH